MSSFDENDRKVDPIANKDSRLSYDTEDGSGVNEKALIRKVDMRLLLILGAIYSVALIDRNNISVARVAGMSKDLELTINNRYSIIALLFFIPYIIFELPSNLLLRRIGCRIQLSSITVLWGAVMLGMGFVTNWQQLAVCRVILGTLESGFFPGCVFLISCWYTRYETNKRMAIFYLTSMVISGFSNILGYAMSLLGGTHGIAAWRWIFIVFGAATIGLGLIGFLLIVDFPDKATFITPAERKFIIDRINVDRGDAEPDSLTFANAMRHLVDPKLWGFGLLFMCSTMPAYAFAYFLPVILAGGGYSTKLSLCLSAPPYVFAAFYTFAVAFASDKMKKRALWILINSIVCTIGLFIMAYTSNIGSRYFGSFLAIAGCQANVPAVVTYQANNVRSHSKRAVASAMVIGMGGVGGIFATTVYRQQDFPKYLPGIWATIGCQFLIWTLLAIMTFTFRRANKQVDEGTRVIEEQEGFKYAL